MLCWPIERGRHLKPKNYQLKWWWLSSSRCIFKKQLHLALPLWLILPKNKKDLGNYDYQSLAFSGISSLGPFSAGGDFVVVWLDTQDFEGPKFIGNNKGVYSIIQRRLHDRAKKGLVMKFSTFSTLAFRKIISLYIWW